MGKSDLVINIGEHCATYLKNCCRATHMQTKPLLNIDPSKLKYAPLAKDTVQLSNCLENGLKALRSNECIKAATERIRFLDLPDDEIIKLIKQGKCSEFQKYFDHESFHNGGLMDFLRSKNFNILNGSKDTLNKYVKEYFDAELEFYRYFDDVLFPVSTNKKVLEIEKKLSKMGIDARLTNHEEEAEQIYTACKKMKEAGINDIPKIRIEALNHSPCSMGIPANNPKDGYVLLGFGKNSNYENANFLVNPTPEGITYHETAHVLNKHFKASDSMLLHTRADSYFQSMKEKLKELVSVYSANNPNEACSEIFTGLMSGKKYPKEIIELLEHYKGYKTIEK